AIGNALCTDSDLIKIEKARDQLSQLGLPFSLHHGNYAGVQQVLGTEGIEAVDTLLVDLGMSSMQVDNPERGFSYVREGPLDMRMDPTRGTTAADLLARLS